MERKLRILLILLGCALAALPAVAKNIGYQCDVDFVVFGGGTLYASDFAAANQQAQGICTSWWGFNAAQAGVHPYVYGGPNPYRFNCLKCGSFDGPQLPLPDVRTALEKALTAQPGKAIGATFGEVIGDDGASRFIYGVDIQQMDLIIRVNVDAETGEVLVPSGDPSGR